MVVEGEEGCLMEGEGCQMKEGVVEVHSVCL
jgi:hypothetical protein